MIYKFVSEDGIQKLVQETTELGGFCIVYLVLQQVDKQDWEAEGEGEGVGRQQEGNQ